MQVTKNIKSQSLKTLERLSYHYKRSVYPSFPVSYIKQDKYGDSSANELTASILAYLKFLNHFDIIKCFATRQQSQGQFNVALKRFTASHVRRGVADISAIVNGLSVQIEVKYGRDKLSEHQMKVQSEVVASGGRYMVARTFEQFYSEFNQMFSVQLNENLTR